MPILIENRPLTLLFDVPNPDRLRIIDLPFASRRAPVLCNHQNDIGIVIREWIVNNGEIPFEYAYLPYQFRPSLGVPRILIWLLPIQCS